MDEIHIEALPPKPSLESVAQPTNWGRTVFTMLLFFAIFMWLGLDVAFLIVLVVVLFIHEGGHFLAMKIFGYRNVNMFFVPFFGAFVSGEKLNAPYRHELIMILAGPVPGILLGMLLAVPAVNGGSTAILLPAFILLGLNVLNLLPVFPLDGARVVDRLFTSGNQHLRIFFLVLSLMAVAAYIIFSGRFFIALISVGIVGQIIGSLSVIRLRKHLASLGYNYKTSYDELTPEAYWPIHRAVQERSPELKNERDVARRVAGVLLYSSPHRLSLPEKLLFLFITLFFFFAPLIEIGVLYRDYYSTLAEKIFG